MKILILTFSILLSASASAGESFGFYEVPREDGQIVNFSSKIEFDGSTLATSEEFTVHFPEDLVGVKNQFVIKKVDDDKWEGDPDLLEKVNCEMGMVFDFACELVFKKEAVVDSSDDDTLLENPDTNLLMVNRSLAEQSLTASALSPSLINTHLESTDKFMSEPIGFFKYREGYIPSN